MCVSMCVCVFHANGTDLYRCQLFGVRRLGSRWEAKNEVASTWREVDPFHERLGYKYELLCFGPNAGI